MGQSTSTAAVRSRRESHHSHRPKPKSTVFVSPMQAEEWNDSGFIDGARDYTSELPDECLACIFQSLGSGDRKRCSLVCRRWLRIEGQSRQRLSLNALADLLPLIPALFSRFDSVTKLALKCDRKSVSISDDALISISIRCGNLTRLKLRACRELTDAGMAVFAKNCKALKKLSCGSCNFGAKGMNAVLDNCASLEELSVKRLRGISTDGAEPIGPGLAASSLKTICLKEFYNGQCFGPLIIGSKSLRTLKLFRCSGDWDKLLQVIADRVTGMVEIHLEKIQVSDVGLAAISNCSNLEILHLVKTPECSNTGLVSVAERCKLLRKLHIDGWKANRIGDEGLIAVSKNCPNLQELVLIGVNPTKFSLEMLASNCLNLERLALCGSDTVGDMEISCIAAKCVALKKLCIKSCPVSDCGLEALAGGCPNLVKVKVKKCRGPTPTPTITLACSSAISRGPPKKKKRKGKGKEKMAQAFSFAMQSFLLTLCSLCFFCSAFTSQDYADALEKSILFFEGQRSGRLPPNQRMTWRGDSGLSDGSTYHVNLVGGYYDAGDNVKFGLPMAFTTTLLAWSVIEFGSSMNNQINNAKAAIRWSTDYLLKAATATPGTLYVQVADPNMDHKCWERPEDMDTARNVYKVTTQNPGSDVAAETAAALAAASIVFQDSDPSYSTKLLQTAMKVFDFADRYRGSYSDSLGSVVCPFYCSYSGYHDELLWGASWLHRASKNTSYLAYIQSNGQTLGANDDDYSFSWDDKRPGTKILLSQGFLEKNTAEFQPYKTHSDNYICSLIPGTPGFQAQYTPGGLLYKASASNLQYVTSTALLLLTYAKYLGSNGAVARCGSSTLTAESLITEAKKQVDYILGDNPAKMSYMVAFGKRYPQHVHHRGSSVPSVHAHPDHISCNDGFHYLYSSSPNPNVLVGAIVGGPDSRDNFADDRNNYQQSEPATYINAPFVGAVAFFSAKN